MAEDKKSFVVYADIKEILDDLSDEQVGQLFRSMVDYQASGIEPELKGSLRYIFIPIRQQMDRDAEKWNKTRAARAESGRKGGFASGRSRRAKNEANEANETNASNKNIETSMDSANERNGSEANEAVNVNVNVNDNVTVNDNATTTVNVPSSGGRFEVDDEFNIWKRLTPDDIDVLYEKFPNSGGLLIDKVFEEVRDKRIKVKSGLNYILGYAKNVGWDDNADHFDGGGMA